MRAHASLAFFWAVSLTGGCASLPGGLEAHAPLAGRLEPTGATVAPPAGLVAFCVEAHCGAQSLGDAQDEAATGAAYEPSNPAMRASGIFQSLVRANAGGVDATNLKLDRVGYDRDLWRLMARVNEGVNWRIAADTDAHIYGEEERWAMPLSLPSRHGGARGDCEDFALEKRAQLILAGVPANALSLVTAISPVAGRHAVLLVRTTRGDFVLDNLHTRPMPVDQLPYVWLAMQSGDRMLAWSAASMRAEGGAAELARLGPVPMKERFSAVS